MAKRDYYDVLGVSGNSDEKEIKRAYRKLAKKYHPDTNAGNPHAEQQFKEITEAYNILSDPEKRKLYDRFGFAAFDGSMGTMNPQEDFGTGWKGRSPGGDSGFGYGGFHNGGFDFHGGGFDFNNGGRYTEYHFESGDGSSAFEYFFGDFFKRGSGENFKSSSGSGFKSGFGGGSGNGFGHGFGAGDTKKGTDMESDITISFEEAAFGCRKQLFFGGNQKPPLEVQIPAGIDDGQRVRLKGRGYPGEGHMPSGDLYIKVHIAKKPGYERKGMDIFTTENIPYTTAVLGGDVIFHTLYGDVKCKIPAGTQSGSKMRLKQKGIVSMKNPSVHGDAYVTIQIAVPKNVTPRERSKLQELQQMSYKNVG
ncbi:MAG: J domain-containing protein [Lachnospiraceae bacterium]|nr:J domain-containing protein [Lachnospiraceae bacterium]